MYEARQNKEKVSRRIDVGSGSRTEQTLQFLNSEKKIRKSIPQKIFQRYVTSYNYQPGSAHVQIKYPVGVADPAPQNFVKAHLVAKRFGGPPGNCNIVYMPYWGNTNMMGVEARVFNYINRNQNCLIDYDVQTVGYSAAYNTALTAIIVARDISVNPPLLI